MDHEAAVKCASEDLRKSERDGRDNADECAQGENHVPCTECLNH